MGDLADWLFDVNTAAVAYHSVGRLTVHKYLLRRRSLVIGSFVERVIGQEGQFYNHQREFLSMRVNKHTC